MRAEKVSMVEEMRRQAEGCAFLFLADYSGMDMEKMQALRAALRGAGARCQVTKNRLFRRISADRGWTQLDKALRGPTALIFGAGDPAAAAKAMEKFIAEHSKPVVKGGMLGSAFMTPRDVAELARMPGRETLYAMVLGTLAAPMSQLVGVLQQKLLSVVYALKAFEEKKRAAG